MTARVIKLTELEPRFILTQQEDHNYLPASNIDTAQGLEFRCPKCYAGNGYQNEGVHHIVLWFDYRVSPVTYKARWAICGASHGNPSLGIPPRRAPSGLDDLTIDPSIRAAPCAWHGYIRGGEIEEAK